MQRGGRENWIVLYCTVLESLSFLMLGYVDGEMGQGFSAEDAAVMDAHLQIQTDFLGAVQGFAKGDDSRIVLIPLLQKEAVSGGDSDAASAWNRVHEIEFELQLRGRELRPFHCEQWDRRTLGGKSGQSRQSNVLIRDRQGGVHAFSVSSHADWPRSVAATTRNRL